MYDTLKQVAERTVAGLENIKFALGSFAVADVYDIYNQAMDSQPTPADQNWTLASSVVVAALVAVGAVESYLDIRDERTR